MPELVVLAVAPGATLQDAGRSGWLHAGVPPSGPLDATAHAAANLAVGNDPRAAALEVPLGPLRFAAFGELTISIDGEKALSLGDGAELLVPPCERAVRYVAIGGAFDVPLVLGSRATLAVAALGGFQGRAIRAGDRLPVGVPGRTTAVPTASPTITEPGDPAVLQVTPGPHLHRLSQGALEQLLATTWQVSPRSDRVGVRLEGASIGRRGDDRAPPVPMVRGAIQVTTDGTPIVLGPDHPVTGGYPVVAVVGRASQAILARLRAKRRVRFALSEAASTD
jgi:biotin-dependent carboxylase-like uncharacterized protein